MKSSYYNGYPTASEIHQDEFAFSKWLSAAADEPNAGRSYALELMGKAMREELTEIQLNYAILYYVHRKPMHEIAEIYGVNKSTVSRTLTRARRKLEKVLRCSSPILLRASLKNKEDDQC